MWIGKCTVCNNLVEALNCRCPVCGAVLPESRPLYKPLFPSCQPDYHFDGDCLENPKGRHPDWIEQWEEIELKEVINAA